MSEDAMWRTQEEQELATLRNERDEWQQAHARVSGTLLTERDEKRELQARLDKVLAMHGGTTYRADDTGERQEQNDDVD